MQGQDVDIAALRLADTEDHILRRRHIADLCEPAVKGQRLALLLNELRDVGVADGGRAVVVRGIVAGAVADQRSRCHGTQDDEAPFGEVGVAHGLRLFDLSGRSRIRLLSESRPPAQSASAATIPMEHFTIADFSRSRRPQLSNRRVTATRRRTAGDKSSVWMYGHPRYSVPVRGDAPLSRRMAAPAGQGIGSAPRGGLSSEIASMRRHQAPAPRFFAGRKRRPA
jgi:hypothetical protein